MAALMSELQQIAAEQAATTKRLEKVMDWQEDLKDWLGLDKPKPLHGQAGYDKHHLSS